jgi:hypothetical protein
MPTRILRNLRIFPDRSSGIVVRRKMVSVRTKLSFCAHEDGAGKQGCAHEDREDGGCVRVAFVRTDLTGQDGWLG